MKHVGCWRTNYTITCTTCTCHITDSRDRSVISTLELYFRFSWGRQHRCGHNWQLIQNAWVAVIIKSLLVSLITIIHRKALYSQICYSSIVRCRPPTQRNAHYSYRLINDRSCRSSEKPTFWLWTAYGYHIHGVTIRYPPEYNDTVMHASWAIEFVALQCVC